MYRIKNVIIKVIMKKRSLSLLILLFAIVSVAYEQPYKIPPMKGNLPNVISSGWKVINLGLTGKPMTACSDVIVFCKISHFSYIPGYGIGRQGSFKMQSNLLTLINSTSDKTKSVYKMTWNATNKILRLEGDGVIMELVYNGVSSCDG